MHITVLISRESIPAHEMHLMPDELKDNWKENNRIKDQLINDWQDDLEKVDDKFIPEVNQ